MSFKVVTPEEMSKYGKLNPDTSEAYIKATNDLIMRSGQSTNIRVSSESIHQHLWVYYKVQKPDNYSEYLDLIDAKDSPFRAAGWKVKWVSGTGERDGGSYNYFVFSAPN